MAGLSKHGEPNTLLNVVEMFWGGASIKGIAKHRDLPEWLVEDAVRLASIMLERCARREQEDDLGERRRLRVGRVDVGDY